MKAQHRIDLLTAALQDAERILSIALVEGQLRKETEAQKQNEFDARGHIGGIRNALREAGA